VRIPNAVSESVVWEISRGQAKSFSEYAWLYRISTWYYLHLYFRKVVN